MAYLECTDDERALFGLATMPSLTDDLFESQLTRLLHAGARLEARDDDGRTVLALAAWAGQPAWRLRRLHDLGAQIDTVDRESNTPLHLASRASKAPAVAELARLGADVGARNKQGRTPLHLAAETGDPLSIRELVHMGATLEERDNQGCSPMTLAMRRGNAGAVGALLRMGCPPVGRQHDEALSVPDWIREENCGPRVAAYCGPQARESLRAQGIELVHAVSNIGRTGLHAAALAGDEDAIGFFLSGGLDPNKSDGHGQTPLMLAASAASAHTARCIDALVAGGALPNGPDDEGLSAPPLMIATRAGHTEAIRALARNGADLNRRAPDERGDTPAELAARLGRLASLQALHELGADIASGGLSGGPLTQAVIGGGPETARWLLDQGVDPSTPDEKGRAPLSWAASFADEREGLRTIATLLDAGALVNARDSQGKTALHAAAQGCQPEACALLIAHGAAPNILDLEGRSALWHAASQGARQTVAALLAGGSDVDLADKDWRAPLHVAVENGNLGVIRQLVEAGANPGALDKAGWTPIHYAADSGAATASEALFALCMSAPSGSLGHGPSALILALQSTGASSLRRVMREPMGLAAARELVALGENPRAVNEAGETALHLAAANGDARAIEGLAALGVDLNAQDKQGQTPLAMAASNAAVEAVWALIGRGADLSLAPTAGYFAGRSPLEIARMSLDASETEKHTQDGKLAVAMLEGAMAARDGQRRFAQAAASGAAGQASDSAAIPGPAAGVAGATDGEAAATPDAKPARASRARGRAQ